MSNVDSYNDGDMMDTYVYEEERLAYRRRRDDICPCCGVDITFDFAVLPIREDGELYVSRMEIVCETCKEWFAWCFGRKGREFPFPALPQEKHGPFEAVLFPPPPGEPC